MSVTATTIVLKRPSVSVSSQATSSPKVSKNKLPIIQPPVFYGCGTSSTRESARVKWIEAAGFEFCVLLTQDWPCAEHIGSMFLTGSTYWKTLYSEAARVVLDSGRLKAQKCTDCDYVLVQTFLCMQCTMVHCQRDAEQHHREKGHSFGADPKSCLLRNPGTRLIGETLLLTAPIAFDRS